jgi:hypothetical protein
MPVGVKKLEDKQIFLKNDPDKGERQIITVRRFGVDGKIVLGIRNLKSGIEYNARLEFLVMKQEIGEREAGVVEHIVDCGLGDGERSLTKKAYRAAG